MSSETLGRRVQRVVIPAAGLGTRFLPASKGIPKELMPVAGRPLIQFAVEEAVASGLSTVILVLSRSKSLVAEYFRRDLELEQVLIQRGHERDATLLCELSELADVQVVWQESPKGLADAIRTARPLLNDEPFAVILPDALIDATPPCISQLIESYENHRGFMLATQMVDPAEADRFGMLEVAPLSDTCCNGRVLRVTNLVERPQAKSTRLSYGIFGRYILGPEIFDSIEHTIPGLGNELQLTDALSLCSQRVPLYAHRFEGTHHDAGNKLGYLQACLWYALKDPELAAPLRDYLAMLEPIAAESAH